MIPFARHFDEWPSVKPAAIILPVQDLTQRAEFSSGKYRN
jgi:hypothetical protein